MPRRILIFLVGAWLGTSFVGAGMAQEPLQPAEQGGQEPGWLVGAYRALVPPYDQGLIAAAFGQNDWALACLDEAIRQDPHRVTAYLLRACVYEEILYYGQAVADCDKALQLDPNQAVAYGLRGIASTWNGDLEHAIADFTEAVRLNPNHPGNLVYRGMCYFARRNMDEAIRDFTAALQVSPGEARIYSLRAVVYFANKDLTRAIDDLKAAQKIEPDNAEYPNALGGFYLITGRRQEAIAAFTMAIDVDPRYAPAFAGRAVVKELVGDYAGAIADNSEAIRIDPDNANANGNLALLLASCPEASLRDGQKAVRLGRRACAVTEWQDVSAINSLAAAFAEIGRFAEAVRLQKKALELAPVDRKELCRSRLKRYQAGQPFRLSETPEADQK